MFGELPVAMSVVPATQNIAASGDWLPQLVSFRLTLPLIMLVLLWTWESLRPFFELKQDRLRHAVRNLTVALLNAAVIGLLFGTVTVLTAEWTVQNRLGLLQLGNSNVTAQFIAGLFLLDGWMYLWHRLNHWVPLLWRFHRMHHSDPHMDVTTATRFHLGEHVISASLRLTLIPILGLSIWQIVVYEMLVVLMTHFHHANISIGHADRWLRYLVVTPDMHKVHHSRWQTETDSNYAVVLSIWDRIARTFHLNPDPQSINFGLDDFSDDRWQSIRGLLKTPLADTTDSQGAKSTE